MRTCAFSGYRLWGAALIAAMAACGGLDEGEPRPADPEALAAAFAASERADVTSTTAIRGSIGTSEERSGVFDPHVAAIGYLVDAGSGAGLTAWLDVAAAADTPGLAEGTSVPALLVAIGPYRGPGDQGRVLAHTVSGELSFDAPESGAYLIAFMTIPPSGHASWRLSMACDGLPEQCNPDSARVCEPETRRVGGVTALDETWASCRIEIDSDVTVPTGGRLTILPGVEVTVPHHGRVDVWGALRILGTPDDPVRIRLADGQRPNMGWAGFRLRAGDHVATYVSVSGARTAFHVSEGGSLRLQNAEISGAGLRHQPTSPLVGIDADGAASLVIERSSIESFRDDAARGDGANIGIRAYRTSSVLIRDSVVRGTSTGIQLRDGWGMRTESRGGGALRCMSSFDRSVPAEFAIERSTISGNHLGFSVMTRTGSLSLVDSNLVDNHSHAMYLSTAIPEAIELTGNNIHSATSREQLVALAAFNGAGLDASGNYWQTAPSVTATACERTIFTQPAAPAPLPAGPTTPVGLAP